MITRHTKMIGGDRHARRLARTAFRQGPNLRRAAAGPDTVLALLLALLLGSTAMAAQQNPPSRLVVEPGATTARVGDSIDVRVELRDAYNDPARAPRRYAIKLEVLAGKSEHPLRTSTVVIRRGHRAVTTRVELEQAGMLRIRASHPQLRETTAFIAVKDDRSARRGDLSPGWSRPRSIVRVARWSLVKAAAQPVAPTGRVLTLLYSHEGTKLTANGRDTDVIVAFLSEAADEPIELHMWASSGRLSPNPIVIPAGEVQARGGLTTDQPGRTKIRLETIRPAHAVSTAIGREAMADFAVPVKALQVQCSPAEVALGWKSECSIQLLGLESELVAADEDKMIEMFVDRQGILEPRILELKKGAISVNGAFLPQAMGDFGVTAATFGATTQEPFRVYAVWPWLTTMMLLTGGLLGGGVRARTAPNWSLRIAQLLTGPVAAFVGYLAVLFGLIPRFGVAATHPFFSLFIGVVAGYAGAALIDTLARGVLGALREVPSRGR
jgi:hypothetical protein